MIQILPKKHISILLSAVFVAIAMLISLVNHYCFRSYYFDTGGYSNALYNYVHFNSDKFLFTTGDHFDFLLVLFSPLSLVLGTYTLPIIQIVALTWGGFGVKKYLHAGNENSILPLYGQAYFYLFYGIYTALAFDYHSNVVAAALVPHLLWALKVKKWRQVSLWFVLILIAKENMSLWLCFILMGYLGQILVQQKVDKQPFDKKSIGILSLMISISGIYFWSVTRIFMPYFLHGISYTDQLYSVLGNHPAEMIAHIFTHPFDLFQTLFINHNHAEHGDYVKMELHISLLISASFVLLLRPQYLLMLLPIFAQKLFHNRPEFWGVGYHYSIEFAPILAIAIFEGLEKCKKYPFIASKIPVFSILILAATGINTIHVFDRTVAYIHRPSIRFYQVAHFTQTTFNIADAYKLMAQIPDTAAVSAQSCFTPHLSLRKHCFQYPDIPSYVSYVMICGETQESYPLSPQEWKKYAKMFRGNDTDDWFLVDSTRNLYVFQRKK